MEQSSVHAHTQKRAMHVNKEHGILISKTHFANLQLIGTLGRFEFQVEIVHLLQLLLVQELQTDAKWRKINKNSQTHVF